MKRKLEKLTSKLEKYDKLKEKLWEQLSKNGYRRKIGENKIYN